MVKVFFPSAAAAGSPRKATTAPAAAEPANNSRRESALRTQVFFPFAAAAGFPCEVFIVHSEYFGRSAQRNCADGIVAAADRRPRPGRSWLA